ncbi:MAG: right-handed parallel beta-helix repeat-containing protein [Myxococcota bacterium]
MVLQRIVPFTILATGCLTALTPCETDVPCEQAFGAGATCDAGSCIRPTMSPTGETGTPAVQPPECKGLIDPIIVPSLVEDATWNCLDVPYVVDGEVRIQGALEIAAGVSVEIAPAGAIVVASTGSLDATGTPDAPITFRRRGSGAWVGLIIEEGKGLARLVHSAFEGTGDTRIGEEPAAITVLRPTTLVHTTIRNSLGTGMRFRGAGEAVAFESNRFENTEGPPISIPADAVGTLSGRHVFEDGATVEVAVGVIARSATWSNLGAPYSVVDLAPNGYYPAPLLIGPVGQEEITTWTIGPGVDIQMGSGIKILVGNYGGGHLVARGEKGAEIHITGPADLEDRWAGINFGTYSVDDGSQLSYTTVERTVGSAIFVSTFESVVVFDHCTVQDADLHGIEVAGYGGVVILDSTIANNGGDGVHGEYGGTAGVLRSTLEMNGGYGINLFEGDLFSLEDDTFIGNGLGALYMPFLELPRVGFGHVGGVDQAISWSEGTDEVLLRPLTLQNLGLAYRVIGSLNVGSPTIKPVPVLTLEAGVRMRFDTTAGLNIGDDGPGGLEVFGTLANPVVLEALQTEWPGLILGNDALPFNPQDLQITGAIGGYVP